MKSTLILLISLLLSGITWGQAKVNDFQSSPKLVLEEVFRAASERDFSNLHKLCPPDESNDGDTQEYICNVASSQADVQEEFINYFAAARITGEVTYSSSENGNKTAQIPFWFNHPNGESRSNETMNFVKIGDKWYLAYF